MTRERGSATSLEQAVGARPAVGSEEGVDERLVEQHLAELHDRLVGFAADAGVLDVAYTTVSSPVGELLLASTAEGLVRVAFEVEDHDAVLVELAERVSPRILRSPARLTETVSQVEEYFAGRLREFTIPVDLRLARGFRRDVVASLAFIDFGTTLSYAQVAAAVGNPGAVRAVGSACATNPVPLVLPCHRVVRSDGTFGNYRGGHDAKRFLLDLEAAA